MAATYEQYTGDGVTANYTIPFPYIERDDVKVYVGGALQVSGADYTFASASTIEFVTAPTNEAAIVIRRISEQDTRVVDFVNGAVLTESDLDLSATQLFYMIQENRDLLETIINGTFVDVGTELLDAVAAQVLGTATALEVQTRIADIDAAGQLLLDEMMARRVVGEVNDDYTAFILDKDTIIVDEAAGETFAQRLSSIGVTLGANTASITTLEAVTGTLEDDVATLEAKYGVTLNVNGYITGFAQHNNGTTGTFDILTDKFRVVDPASGGQNPTVVFAIESGNVLLQNLYLHQLTLGATGHIKRGKASASDTTAGFWLGYDGTSAYDFHIGDATSSLWWDASAATLKINGDVSAGRLKTKAASTNRNTTTTFADDPDLVITGVQPGTYKATLLLRTFCGVAGADFKAQLAFSGTASALVGHGSYTPEAPYSGTIVTLGPVTTFDVGIVDMGASVAYVTIFECIFTVTDAGTLSLQWAQNVSDATNTTLVAGSFMSLQRHI